MTWFGLMWLIWFDLICLDAQLGTYQPPIPKTYPASAWSYMYIGRWMCKTECSPTGLVKKIVSLNGWKIPRQKWLISCLWEHFLVSEHQILIWLCWTLDAVGNSLRFIDIWSMDFPWTQEIIEIHCVLLTFWSMDFPWTQEIIEIPCVLLTFWNRAFLHLLKFIEIP